MAFTTGLTLFLESAANEAGDVLSTLLTTTAPPCLPQYFYIIWEENTGGGGVGKHSVVEGDDVGKSCIALTGWNLQGRPNKKGEVLLTGEYAQGGLDECRGAGEEGEREASGEQD